MHMLQASWRPPGPEHASFTVCVGARSSPSGSISLFYILFPNRRGGGEGGSMGSAMGVSLSPCQWDSPQGLNRATHMNAWPHTRSRLHLLAHLQDEEGMGRV